MIVFAKGSLELVHPVNNTEDLNYFGIATTFDAPEQAIQKWSYIGQNGQQIKTLGTGGQSGAVHGFLDAITEVQLDVGVQFLKAAVASTTAEDIKIGTSTTVANGLLTRVAFTRYWAYGNRFCADFVLAWEAP